MEIARISSFLDYYERVRERTLRVIEVVPPDKVNWAYMPGKFTIADIIRHIAAIERNLYAECVLGNPSLYEGCGTDLADGYEGVLAYLHNMHRESLAILRGLTEEDLQRKCRTPAGGRYGFGNGCVRW